MSESKFQIWLLASRPKTLPAAASPVLIGTAMAFQAGSFHLYSAIAALLGALFIQIGTNLANDYFDFKKGTDREDRTGPTRVTQAGLVSSSDIKKAIILTFGIAFLIGIYLVYRGGIPIVIIGVSSILFGLLYTGGPLPIGYIGLGELFVLIFFGPVAVGGTYYVQTLSITNSVIIAGFAPGLFSVAILVVNNLRDINSDKITGKKTLAVRFGETFSKLEYLFSVFIAFLIPVYFYFSTKNIFICLPLLTIMIAIPTIVKCFSLKGELLNNVLASTGMVLFLFSILFSLGWIL